MKKILFVAIAVLAGFAGTKYYASNQETSGSNLLLQNVEALTSSGESDYSGFAKDYEAGEGLYVTKITGQVSGNITIGMRISNTVAAELKGQIVAEVKAEWKMTCQANMGCYTTCTNEDWRMGNRSSGLVRGCQ